MVLCGNGTREMDPSTSSFFRFHFFESTRLKLMVFES